MKTFEVNYKYRNLFKRNKTIVLKNKYLRTTILKQFYAIKISTLSKLNKKLKIYNTLYKLVL